VVASVGSRHDEEFHGDAAVGYLFDAAVDLVDLGEAAVGRGLAMEGSSGLVGPSIGGSGF